MHVSTDHHAVEPATMAPAELFAAAQALDQAGAVPRAIALYKSWLEHAVSPLAFAAWFHLALLQDDSGDAAAAELSYRKAIRQNPAFIEPRIYLGMLCERQGRTDDALAAWRAILDIAEAPDDRPLRLQAINHIGRLLETTAQLVEACTWLTRSLEQDANQPRVLAHWVHLRQRLCRWPACAPFGDVTLEAMLGCMSSLTTLAASDDPAVQRAASQRYVDAKAAAGPQAAPLHPADGYRHGRLRIGYLSSNLCAHAVSILTAQLYELHDRARFEVHAFCWSPEDGSPLRARVTGAMDHYHRIDAMTDEEAARHIRAHEIDILVDLHGLTAGARIGILAYRPAPVQLTWLGFPGTTAIPGIDYVIADDFVLPPELEPFFTERPLRMPHTFQVNDRRRAIGPPLQRADNRLPDEACVFCCFNGSFKITPQVFAAWMRILRQVPGSVLWLVADVAETAVNLRRAALGHGIAPERLVFADRVPPADYLARLRLADLFLDTAPFNGGTTASDALWAGLPVLTCSGRTFSSRMAGSLLHAVGLPELVTHTLADYEAAAVALGTDRLRLVALRTRLAANSAACALFDTPRFVRDFEDLLASVVRRPEGVPLAN